MEVIRELHLLPVLSHPVVALGNFDGVHLGHQAILKAAIGVGLVGITAYLVVSFMPTIKAALKK
jgi:FAD synthase